MLIQVARREPFTSCSLGKKMMGGSGRSTLARQDTGFLTKIFDKDNDGSMIDDVLGMAFKAVISR